jgi:hypothetical protein
MVQSITTWGRQLYFSSELSRAAYFLLPLKSISSAGYTRTPAKLGSNGNHANHYTAEVTTPQIVLQVLVKQETISWGT